MNARFPATQFTFFLEFADIANIVKCGFFEIILHQSVTIQILFFLMVVVGVRMKFGGGTMD